MKSGPQPKLSTNRHSTSVIHVRISSQNTLTSNISKTGKTQSPLVKFIMVSIRIDILSPISQINVNCLLDLPKDFPVLQNLWSKLVELPSSGIYSENHRKMLFWRDFVFASLHEITRPDVFLNNF